jgi:hypothetical protein
MIIYLGWSLTNDLVINARRIKTTDITVRLKADRNNGEKSVNKTCWPYKNTK